MTTVPVTRPRVWHPLAGAALVGGLAVLAVVTRFIGAPGVVVSAVAFLAMGAVAGFSVSGST